MGRAAPALRDVSFEVEPGECLLVLGPSGSGKSTLALAVAGLVPHELAGAWGGRLEVDGLLTTAVARTALAERVGIVFQDPSSQIVMERVEDDVAFGLENRGYLPSEMRATVPTALAAVGLTGFERRRTTRLSGGEQQRLALAGVLSPQPGVLVLDEPTANLDPSAAAAFLDRLARLRAARATTIVLVEHRVDATWPLADRVLALDRDGSVIDTGPPGEVLARSRARLDAAGIWLPRDVEAPEPQRVAPSSATLGAASVATVEGVSFAYEPSRSVLHDVTFAIRRGERAVLVGPNGSGKSTLGRLVVGLLRPQRGVTRLAGDDPARLPASLLARRAGYVFQDPERQFLTTRVVDEVSVGLDHEERRRVPELMDRLGLPVGAFGDRSPYTLSGGEQRRLSLACVLVRRPPVLVLDEPTFGQDRHGYEGLLAILQQQLEVGTATLAATHDARFIDDFAARILAMEAGRIVRDERAAVA